MTLSDPWPTGKLSQVVSSSVFASDSIGDLVINFIQDCNISCRWLV